MSAATMSAAWLARDSWKACAAPWKPGYDALSEHALTYRRQAMVSRLSKLLVEVRGERDQILGVQTSSRHERSLAAPKIYAVEHQTLHPRVSMALGQRQKEALGLDAEAVSQQAADKLGP